MALNTIFSKREIDIYTFYQIIFVIDNSRFLIDLKIFIGLLNTNQNLYILRILKKISI